MNIDEYEESLDKNDNGDGGDDLSLEELVEQYNAQSQEDDADAGDDGDKPDSETNDDKPKPGDGDKPKPEDNPKPEGNSKPEDGSQKRVQTPEENAHFAEQRRQREAKIAENALKASQEYQIVQMLARMSNKTPEQLMQDLRAAEVQADLQRQGLPPEQALAAVPQVLSERQRAEQAQARVQELETTNIQHEFEKWQNRMATEASAIKTNHPYLTDEDIEQARGYILGTLKNPNVPLEQAVYAVHGQKISQEQRKLIRTEVLAELSGRKGNSPLPPQGGSGSSTEVLTSDERFAAKALGLSDSDYLKWKKNPE